MSAIPYRLGLQQRVLPVYRAPFFEALADACGGELSVCAGQPRTDEAIETTDVLLGAHLFKARNLHIFSGGAYLCWQAGLLTWLNAWQPQVLILEANPRYLNSPQAARWMHRRNRPVIGWGLGAPQPQGAFSQQRSAARRRFLSAFDALIAYSAQGKQEYAAAGVDPDRIFIAPNAAVGRPELPPPDRPSSKSGTRLTLLSVGRLQRRKRIDLLICACARLPEALQPELVIVGEGPERANLEAFARSEYPRAQFAGARFGSDLEPFYQQADLFVLPGTGGLAVQQAMSRALPVIVAEADGTQADLVSSENGWLIPPGDLETLTIHLTDALTDLSRLRRMGAASYRIVAEEINLEKMVAVFATAVQAVMSRYSHSS